MINSQRDEGFRTGLHKNELEKDAFIPLGLMRARVEYHNDPKRIGRVRVRIPSIHGVPNLTKEWIPLENLPWASPCFSGGVGQDFGQFIPPVPGTFVWVMFEDNDRDKPVYLGGIPSTAHNVSREMNNLTDEDSPLQKWNTQTGIEDTPKEIFDKKSTGIPERFCIYKSQKGHAIIFDDTDGEESVSIIDRAGQIVKFNCHVSKDDNEGGYFRGLGTAENKGQLDKVDDPSILIQTGPTIEGKQHSKAEVWINKFHAEFIDLDEADVKTTTDCANNFFTQRTKDSILDMFPDYIRLTYPKIVEYMCDDYFSITAFDKNILYMDQDKFSLLRGQNGITGDDDKILINFGENTIELNEDGVFIKGKDYKIEAGKSIVESDDGSTNVKGKEVHFN